MDANPNRTQQATPSRLTESHDESLVHDVRGRMSPAELIERKLSRLLHDTPVPISHQTMTRRLARQL